ncbi:hypothetical protein R1flu_005974 [Riccia fluitans]|uniref:Uncharacterized protein n=1 Tax=Riccia fluitans TaxID=41844 RepID=A0ABD1YVI2_9MARC
METRPYNMRHGLRRPIRPDRGYQVADPDLVVVETNRGLQRCGLGDRRGVRQGPRWPSQRPVQVRSAACCQMDGSPRVEAAWQREMARRFNLAAEYVRSNAMASGLHECLERSVPMPIALLNKGKGKWSNLVSFSRLTFMEIRHWNQSDDNLASTLMDLGAFHVPREWTITGDGGRLWVTPGLILDWGWMQAESSRGTLTCTCLQRLIPRWGTACGSEIKQRELLLSQTVLSARAKMGELPNYQKFSQENSKGGNSLGLVRLEGRQGADPDSLVRD